MTEPCCTVEYHDHDYVYRVYDRMGSLMCITHSRSVADQFLGMARLGITARLYYWLERWRWRVPKRYLDRL